MLYETECCFFCAATRLTDDTCNVYFVKSWLLSPGFNCSFVDYDL